MRKQKVVTERIVNYVAEHIRNGDWKLGSKISSENVLCRELGASRTSVRSALQRFTVLGILESQHGRGTFVRSTDLSLLGRQTEIPQETSEKNEDKHFYDWHEARNIIEPEIAYRAAKAATPEFVEKLYRINEEQRTALGNQEMFIEKDIEFHMALAEFVGNDIIIGFMREIMSDKNLHTMNNDEFGYFGGIYFHRIITEAISSHDAERARNFMLGHGVEAARFIGIDSFKNNVHMIDRKKEMEKKHV